MQLTEEQVQYIENRLEKDGVNYWDIRMEMLDHVVTDVEKRIDLGEKFKDAVQDSFISLGWKENFNGSCFEKVIAEKLNVYSREYGRSFWKYFKTSIINTSTIVFSLSYLIVFYSISKYELVFKIVLFSYLAVMIAFLFYYLTKYRVRKSVQLESALSKATFSLMFINAFIYMPKLFEIDVLNYRLLTTVFFWFITIQSFYGISFFNKEYKKVNNIYKQLIA
ncbi:hypothetical protein WH52_04385 [Tenacibaculum holothuriorum]|uniref:Uncharacterized protein n=1 Tax=Tenacibaculum holothuriorum TaxID=1635173 RepID=A0A1Y2PGI6_9FLAO|nr:hypothetical protein [Tenacibaculum holothuriorum]OSY88907.1 hypothetical protein WH52_04385 [Tenacibaculum holothuriorum]